MTESRRHARPSRTLEKKLKPNEPSCPLRFFLLFILSSCDSSSNVRHPTLPAAWSSGCAFCIYVYIAILLRCWCGTWWYAIIRVKVIVIILTIISIWLYCECYPQQQIVAVGMIQKLKTKLNKLTTLLTSTYMFSCTSCVNFNSSIIFAKRTCCFTICCQCLPWQLPWGQTSGRCIMQLVKMRTDPKCIELAADVLRRCCQNSLQQQQEQVPCEHVPTTHTIDDPSAMSIITSESS